MPRDQYSTVPNASGLKIRIKRKRGKDTVYGIRYRVYGVGKLDLPKCIHEFVPFIPYSRHQIGGVFLTSSIKNRSRTFPVRGEHNPAIFAATAPGVQYTRPFPSPLKKNGVSRMEFRGIDILQSLPG